MRIIYGLALLAVAACSPADTGRANYSQSDVEAARAEGYAAALKETASEPIEEESALAEVLAEVPPPPTPKPEPVSLCWQDYCPCEGEQGGPDEGLCRQLKAGLPVDPQLMSAAAMMRDARKQMADLEAEHGEF
jgi:hypothetical protein